MFSTGKGLNTQYNIGAINKQLMPYIQEDANAGDKEAQSYINYLNNIVKMSADNVDENYVYDMTKNVAKNAAAQFGNEEVLSTAAEGGAAISVNAVNGMAGDDTKFTTTHQLQSIKRTDLKDMPIGKGLFEFGVGFGTVAAEGASTEGAEAMAEAGETVAGAFIISLRDNLVSLLQGVLGVDGDFMSPTIKPVVDTSGANKSLKELFGIGSGKNPIDLTTTSNLNMSYKDSNSKLIDAIKGNTNQDVVEAVQQLSEIVNLFRGEATSLNVVMDTGAMVGALGHPIDLYLGQQSMNSGRGMQ